MAPMELGSEPVADFPTQRFAVLIASIRPSSICVRGFRRQYSTTEAYTTAEAANADVGASFTEERA